MMHYEAVLSTTLRFVHKVKVDNMLSWLDERLYPSDELKYVSPSVLMSSSSSSSPSALSSGAEVLLRLSDTKQRYNSDTKTGKGCKADIFKNCFYAFTWSRFAEFWVGSAAAHWPPVARPGLSAASSCCAPVGRSLLQLHPSAFLRPLDADSTSRRSHTLKGFNADRQIQCMC